MNNDAYQKMINTLRYITQSIHELYTIYAVLYFADKRHLSRYGRPVCDFYEVYRADKYVILPIFSHDILYGEQFTLDPTGFNSVAPAELDYLSESDLKCLDETMKEFKDKKQHRVKSDPDRIIKLFQNEECWKSTKVGEKISWRKIVELDIENGQEILEYWDC